ncbi:MAG TPA: hypothetical protein PKD86_12545 [Gemmatales bacterium]|nr:hypothetical protein [Gemmatales bacterium]HMP60171.1 hypothetical protein [Gemmatales bacterium]
MKRAWFWVCLVAFLGRDLPVNADDDLDEEPVPMHVGPVFPLAASPDRPLTLNLEEHGFPPPGPPISLFSPFEVFARTGSSFSSGSGPLDRGLRSMGVGVEGGARSFFYNPSRSAAWTAEVGIEYLYNNVRGGDVFLTRGAFINVFRFQQPTPLRSVSEYTFRELHRTSARLALGREWYFGGDTPDGLRYSFGCDVGGRWGRAHAKMVTVNREIEGLFNFDVVPDLQDGHTGDVLKGVFLAGHTQWFVPCDGYDIVFGGRFEWGKDFFVVADRDDGVSQFKIMFTAGLRY